MLVLVVEISGNKYKGHAGNKKTVYRGLFLFSDLHESISTRLKQVSCIERCALFGVSFIIGSMA